MEFIVEGKDLSNVVNFLSIDKVYQIKVEVLGDRNLSEKDVEEVMEQVDKTLKEQKESK